MNKVAIFVGFHGGKAASLLLKLKRIFVVNRSMGRRSPMPGSDGNFLVSLWPAENKTIVVSGQTPSNKANRLNENSVQRSGPDLEHS